MSKTIWYSSGDCERFELRIPATLCIERPREQQTIAELCAADFHYNHDGWRSDWPRDLSLYESERGEPFAVLNVDWEVMPRFVAKPPSGVNP